MKREREERERKETEERVKKMNGIINVNEMKQLEEWTTMKCEEIIFDSTKDNWSQHSSVFDEKVMNKEHIIIIVEDGENNTFGYYFNGKIEDYKNDVQSLNCFIFSLKSNGRLHGMTKFEQSNFEQQIYIGDKAGELLIGICDGFWIMKQNITNQSYIWQDQNNQFIYYKGIENALNGKGFPNTFSPKRIVVIQMN